MVKMNIRIGNEEIDVELSNEGRDYIHSSVYTERTMCTDGREHEIKKLRMGRYRTKLVCSKCQEIIGYAVC